jgi:hypothetical protein
VGGRIKSRGMALIRSSIGFRIMGRILKQLANHSSRRGGGCDVEERRGGLRFLGFCALCTAEVPVQAI